MLAASAVPALLIFSFRLGVPESPLWLTAARIDATLMPHLQIEPRISRRIAQEAGTYWMNRFSQPDWYSVSDSGVRSDGLGSAMSWARATLPSMPGRALA